MRLRHVTRAPGVGPRGMRERGAALIEFALLVPFFVLLIAGSVDLGSAWRMGLVANTSSRAAARLASNAGPNPLADWYALSGLRSSFQSSVALSKVQRVIIYKSTTADGKVPAGCLSGSPGSALCNIITGPQLWSMTQASFNTTTGCFTAATTKNWCPSSRNNVQITADYIGVFVEVRQPYKFAKVLGSGVTIRRTTVMRLEPKET